jgi:hypothetical protein
MSTFAVLALFGLGITAFAAIGRRYLTGRPDLRTLVMVGAGIGLAWAADFNMWNGWELHIRAGWIGVTLTGLTLGGIAYFWDEILSFFAGLVRKYNDEADALEMERELRRIA